MGWARHEAFLLLVYWCISGGVLASCIPRSAAELFLKAGPPVHLLGAGGGAAGPSYWHEAAGRVGQFTIIIFIIYMT